MEFKANWSRSIRKDMSSAQRAARIAATNGMRLTVDGSSGMKARMRAQVQAAGLGKVANSVRSAVFPRGATKSLNPAGTVFFKAPHIIRSFTDGSVIRPTGGGRMLAIPTRDCPYGRGGRHITPKEATQRFGPGTSFRAKSGEVFLSFLAATSKDGLGLRKASTKPRAKARRGEQVIFYRLVPMVRMPKRLDPNAVLQAAATQLNVNIGAAWPQDLDRLT